MLKELSWYIETNRFTNIVEEIEGKAAAYSEALRKDSENKEELRDDLRALCQWHMEKSGYKTESVQYINIDMEFFNGHEINRAALNTFEKEIVKAHMYQKHLWEFMGTTGSMTVISRTAMRQDGFAYESYLPLEYKKTHKAKSPISNILKENPSAVPFYIYSDGTVSSEYNPEKSKSRLDALRDRSGFDWTRKGWDPNYEVRKDGWHGEYDETGTWTMVREGKGEQEKAGYAGARLEKLPEIEILKDGDSAILYDPGYSLISPSSRIFLLTDGGIYGAEQENAEKNVSLIKEAMGEMGIKSIKAVCGGKDSPAAKRLNARLLMEESSAEDDPSKKASSPIRQKRGNKITKERILSLYKKLLGEILQSNAGIASCKEYKTTRKELAEKAGSKRIEDSGRALSEKISAVKSSGARGEELIWAIQTGKTKIPLSVFNLADKKEAGLTDDEFSQIQNYAVPESKKELFSRAILNLILERETIRTSGKEAGALFDAVYADVVQGKKSDETISVETTFSELCNNPEKSLWRGSVEAATIEKLREAKRSLPAQTTPELQKKVNTAVDSIIRSFSAVRMSTGMTPEEAVRLAARTAGGKDTGVFVPPASGIVYQAPARSRPSSALDGSSIRIFSDIQIADLIEAAKNLPPPTKEAGIGRLIAETRGGRPKETASPSLNLFDKEEREEWYKTESFRKTGLSVSDAENLVQSEEEKTREEISSSDENIIKFSRMAELDRRMGYNARDAGENRNALIARIEPATRSVDAEETAGRLNGESESAGIPAGYMAARINADGRISRKIAGAAAPDDFAEERDRIISGENAQKNVPAGDENGKTFASSSEEIEDSTIPSRSNTNAICERYTDNESVSATAARSGVVHEVYAKSTGKEIHSAVSANETNSQPDAGSVHFPTEYTENGSEVSGNESAYSAAAKTGPSHSYVHGGEGGNTSISTKQNSSKSNVRASSQSKPMPASEQEAARLERMSANYGHDRAVLAKTDPLFARSEFRDAGHAGGSREESDREKIKRDTRRVEWMIDSQLKDNGGI